MFDKVIDTNSYKQVCVAIPQFMLSGSVLTGFQSQHEKSDKFSHFFDGLLLDIYT
jgi:hypothetical protein